MAKCNCGMKVGNDEKCPVCGRAICGNCAVTKPCTHGGMRSKTGAQRSKRKGNGDTEDGLIVRPLWML